MNKDAKQQWQAGQEMSDEQQQQMMGARRKLGGIIKTDMPMRKNIMRILITIVLIPFVLLSELYKASKEYVIDFVVGVVQYDYIGLIIRGGTQIYDILCVLGQLLYKIVYFMNKVRTRNSGRVRRLVKAIFHYVMLGIKYLGYGLQFIYKHTILRVFQCLEYLWDNFAEPIYMAMYYGIIYISDILDHAQKQVKQAFNYLWNQIIMYYMIKLYKQIVRVIRYVIQRAIGYLIIKPWRLFVRCMKYINQYVVQLINKLYQLVTKVTNTLVDYAVSSITYLCRQFIKLTCYCGNLIKQLSIYLWDKFIIGCQHIYRAGISFIKLIYRIEKGLWKYTVQFWDYIYPKLIIMIRVLIVKPVTKITLLLVDAWLWWFDKLLKFGVKLLEFIQLLSHWAYLFYQNMILAYKASIKLGKQYITKPIWHFIQFSGRKSCELVKAIYYYFIQFLMWVQIKVIRPACHYLLQGVVIFLEYFLEFLIFTGKQSISVYKILRIMFKYLIIDTARFIKYAVLKLYHAIYTVFHFIYRCLYWFCIKVYNLVIFLYNQSIRFYLFLDKTTRKIWSIIKLKLIFPAYYGLVSLKNFIVNSLVVPMVELIKWFAGETVRVWHIIKSIVVNWMITVLRIIKITYIAIKTQLIAIKTQLIAIIQSIRNTITSVNEFVKVNILQPPISLIKSQWHNVMESIIKPTKAFIISIKNATVSAYQTQKEISLQHANYIANQVKQISQSTKEYIIQTKQYVGAQLTLIKEQFTAIKSSMTEYVKETKLRITELSMQIKQQIIDIKNSIRS